METSNLTIMALTFMLATLLPLLVGLVTRMSTHPGAKAVLLLGFTAAAGLLSELLAAVKGHNPYDWTLALFTWGGSFVTAVAMHFGVWAPTGVTTTVQKMGVTDRPGSPTFVARPE